MGTVLFLGIYGKYIKFVWVLIKELYLNINICWQTASVTLEEQRSVYVTRSLGHAYVNLGLVGLAVTSACLATMVTQIVGLAAVVRWAVPPRSVMLLENVLA